jgi:hypothetical protein
VDEDGVVLVDLLQVDDEFSGIVLGIGENLCTKESDNVIRDYLDGLVAKISVVDAQLGVKPVDFIRDELSWDETLRWVSIKIECAAASLEATSCTLDATST